MHFTYKYINHEIEKFQKYLDFIFLNVWCKAKGRFNTNKVRGYPELKNIFEILYNENSKSAKTFIKYIENIFIEFTKLDKPSKSLIKKWYKKNNRISCLCKNISITPVKYDTLIKRFPILGNELKRFYTILYGKKSPFKLVAFGDYDAIKKNHYREIINLNFEGHEGICPFCGLNPIRGNDHKPIEAYDHFMPKGNYPFISVNMKNLAPMCNECNSYYKSSKSPLLTQNKTKGSFIRRKAIYPYSKRKIRFTINVQLVNSNIKTLSNEEIKITTNSSSKFEELENWMEIFGIEERYRAKILGTYAGLNWYNKLCEGYLNAKKLLKKPDLSKEEWLEYLINECEENILSECNFLKKPFYSECARLSIN